MRKRNEYSEELTQVVLERVEYDPDTGKLTWKAMHPQRPDLVGKEIGAIHRGYRYAVIGFQGKKWTMPAAHIAWRIGTGEWPATSMTIDHKDGNPLNNSLSNLRLATLSQQSLNKFKPKGRYKDLPRGVYLREKRDNPYGARICLEGKVKWLGAFDCCKKAENAYNAEAAKLHGEFAFINREVKGVHDE